MLESPRISLDEFGVSLHNGFLPSEQPLRKLPDPYYAPWEAIMIDLPALIQTERIRQEVLSLPVLSTEKLNHEAEWQRAYLILAFLTHAYIWGGARPEDVSTFYFSFRTALVCELTLTVIETSAAHYNPLSTSL
jgi:indoleamine 2,3-dioxygenase